MNGLYSFSLAVVVSALVAVTFGLALGRISTQWFGGRGISNLLTEVRGGLLPFLLIPLLESLALGPRWLTLALVVGGSQAIAVAHWIGRRSGEWSPALVGGIALGRSGAALATRRAASRGAVTATLATGVFQLVSLDGLLFLLFPERPSAAFGQWIINAGPIPLTLGLLALGVTALIVETLSAALLRRGSSRL